MKPIIVTYSNFSYITSAEGWYAMTNFEFGYFHRIGSDYLYRVYERDIKLIARPKNKKNMLIAITEINAWERERWTYVLDIDKQDGEVINNLMIFIRVANKHFDEVKEKASYTFFAASRYSYKFYNKIDLTNKHPRLENKNSSLIIASDPGYNSHSFDLDLVISSSRMKSAMLRMRDKKENDIYKNFNSLFLKKKTKALTDK